MEELNRKILEVKVGKVDKKEFQKYIEDERQIGMFQIKQLNYNNRQYELQTINEPLKIQSSGFGSWNFYVNSISSDYSDKFKIPITGNYRITFQLTCFDTNYDDSDPVYLTLNYGESEEAYRFPLDKFTTITPQNREILISRKDMITYTFNQLFYLNFDDEFYFKLKSTNNTGFIYENIKLAGSLIDFENSLITDYRQVLVDTSLTTFIVEYVCHGHPI